MEYSDGQLIVENLEVSFTADDDSKTKVVRGISLKVCRGERVALVGESGCGKSMTALSITKLPPTDRATISGKVFFDGKPIDGPGNNIAYVFQDPMASLNPVMRIGKQLSEALPARWHRKTEHEKREHLASLLSDVDLPSPEALLRAYPCELSGGMCQRVMIAMALALEPKLLIADEPTTALDVTTQADVMDLIERIVNSRGMSLLLSTHNMGLVTGRCDRVYVLYAGQVVETGSVKDVLITPSHPYTQGLLRAVPRISAGRENQLRDIPGIVPSPKEITNMTGCAFKPRCPFASATCSVDVPLRNGVRCMLH